MKRSLSTIMAALALQGAAWGQDNGADAALVEMRNAFNQRNADKVAALLPSVRGHVLEPLALYWATKPQLETAAPSSIRATLSRMRGSYWEDRLRNDWLLVLGKNRDWANFEAGLPGIRMKDDRQVQCYGLMLDAAAKRVPAGEAAQQTAERWHQQRDADDGCATAAKAFLDSGHMPAQAAWMRARLAMEANKPEAALQAIGMLNPEWAEIAKDIAKDPGAYLDDKITAIRPRTKELVTLAIIRLGAIDLPAAVQTLQRKRWTVQLTKEELGWAWGSLGQRAAKSLDPQALTYYANGQDHFMSADHLAWKARAGMRAGQWHAVRDAIAAMGPEQRKEAVWVYWRARSLLALRLPDAPIQAQTLYASIASPNGFYEQLAREELGQPIEVPPMPEPVSVEEQRAAENNPGIQRALASFRLGLRSEAVREWHYTVALHNEVDLSDRELLAMAKIACDNSLWDRCINTSLRTENALNHQQRFPTPYLPQVTQRAQSIGLDPAYVYGLIRQESRFVVSARSGVGASGLMQVMPATARWTARKIGLTDFRPSQINERDTNIQIGTAYLKLALDDFEGSMPMAAAAYNAGPGRPRKWREGPALAGEIWTENIPFDETRDYVKHVLANTTNYAALLTGQPQSLRARLGVVTPAPAKSAPDPEFQ
jgi:soluble lytic murein transglycosylase